MSVIQVDKSGERKRTRKLYSKGGCKECKRRKIKCNEAKPSCWQCERLSKLCQYLPIKEKKTTLNKNKKRLSDNLRQSEKLNETQDAEDLPGTHITTESETSENNLVGNTDTRSSNETNPTVDTAPILNLTEMSIQSRHSTCLFKKIPVNQQGQCGYLRKFNESTSQYPLKKHIIRDHYPTTFGLDLAPINLDFQKSNYVDSPTSQTNSSTTSRIQISSYDNQHGSGSKDVRTSSLCRNLTSISNSSANTIPHNRKPFDCDSETVISESNNRIEMAKNHTLSSEKSTAFIHNENSLEPSYSIHDKDVHLETHNSFQDDLNLLASDLNGLVSDIMFDDFNGDREQTITSHPEKSKSEFGELDSFAVPLGNLNGGNVGINLIELVSKNEGKSEKFLYGGVDDGIQKNIPFDFLKVNKPHEKLYLDEFYNDYSNVILPFSAYDEELETAINPVRDILLTYASREPYLLAAIFAQGAKTSFNKNGMVEDEKAYNRYLSICLKLLESTLKTSEAIDDEKELTTNIEAVLLTVLLLTSANASNVKQKWRAHLRGAKDLLLKYFFNSSSCSSKYSTIRRSRILIFCKYWFISIEILAGLCSNIGGTIVSDRELDLIISLEDAFEIQVMKELKLIKGNEFNILFGYNNSCATHLRDLVKILNKRRAKGTRFEATNSLEYIRLLSNFYDQSKIHFISQDCLLPSDSFKNVKFFESELIDNALVNRNIVLVSWMDISHQAYVSASLITILTECFNLQYNSPQICTLTNDFLSRMKFLMKASECPLRMKYSTMIIQWPMLIAGMNCTQEEHKYLILKYFRFSGHIGSGSAAIALRKVNNAWLLHSDEVLPTDYQDVEENGEYVAY